MKKTNCGPNSIQWDLLFTFFSIFFLDNRHCNQYSWNWFNRSFCLWFIFRIGFQTVKGYIGWSRAGKCFGLFQWFVSNTATEKLTNVPMHLLEGNLFFLKILFVFLAPPAQVSLLLRLDSAGMLYRAKHQLCCFFCLVQNMPLFTKKIADEERSTEAKVKVAGPNLEFCFVHLDCLMRFQAEAFLQRKVKVT